IVSFSLGGGGQKLDAQTAAIPTNQVDSWIALWQDGTVTAYSGRCDFGQGFRTVQQQLVAEELGIPLDRIKMVICDTAYTPDQGTSSGSQAHPTQFGNNALRQALATAREALLQMASDQWKIPMSEIVMENGLIRASQSGLRQMNYGDVLGGRRLNL